MPNRRRSFASRIVGAQGVEQAVGRVLDLRGLPPDFASIFESRLRDSLIGGLESEEQVVDPVAQPPRAALRKVVEQTVLLVGVGIHGEGLV